MRTLAVGGEKASRTVFYGEQQEDPSGAVRTTLLSAAERRKRRP
jgi:hypothetical protein